MNKISFPGLGIDEFTVSETAFWNVKWYGLIITFGMIVAVSYIYFRTKKQKLLFDDLLDLALFTIPLGVLGARLYYIFTDNGNGSLFSQVMANDELSFGKKIFELFNIPGGGLAIYGGIIAGLCTVVLVCRYKRINLLKFLDATGPAVMIAQAIGRWGNFFNAEAYGSQTDLPWRMGLLPNMDSTVTMHYYHPTFFYESLWNVIGFTLINIFYKKKKFDGQWFLSYIAWYGLGRAFIELLRTDSLWIFNHTIRVSTLVGGLSFVVSVVAMIWLWIKNKDRELSPIIYYENAKHHPDNLISSEKSEKEESENTEDTAENTTKIDTEDQDKK